MPSKIYHLFIFIFFSLFFFNTKLNSQISFNGGFNYLNYESQDRTSQEVLNEKLSGFSFELAYWFRLKDYRVEFYPGVGLSLLNSNSHSAIDDFDLRLTHLFWATRIYPFSFEDDCMCPTFNKQSGIFEDGFFVSLTPHYLFAENSVKWSSEEYKVKSNTFMLDLGIGLDIGISEFLTLTPEIRYRLSGDFSSPPLQDFENANNWETSFSGWFWGVGLGFRWKD